MVMKSYALQTNRYELKFLIDESMATSIRHFVRAHLEPDPYMPADSHRGYWVESIYLDSHNLDLCRQTEAGLRNRFKLRIRSYDEKDDSAAFLEVKYRRSDTVQKRRAMVAKASAINLLGGRALTTADLMDPTPDQQQALGLFCEKMDQVQASPNVYVNYIREAYVPRAGNSARVTFDRELTAIEYRPSTTKHGNTPHEDCSRVPAMSNGQVVMELKFTDRFPFWMRELTHSFGLRRIPFPKYVKCVDAVSPLGLFSDDRRTVRVV